MAPVGTLMESVMEMQWWHWAVLGLVLGLLELATPGAVSYTHLTLPTILLV